METQLIVNLRLLFRCVKEFSELIFTERSPLRNEHLSFSVKHTNPNRARHKYRLFKTQPPLLTPSGALKSSKSPHKLFNVFLGTFGIMWSYTNTATSSQRIFVVSLKIKLPKPCQPEGVLNLWSETKLSVNQGSIVLCKVHDAFADHAICSLIPLIRDALLYQSLSSSL